MGEFQRKHHGKKKILNQGSKQKTVLIKDNEKTKESKNKLSILIPGENCSEIKIKLI